MYAKAAYKKFSDGKLVLGCFFGLEFVASAGCVPKSAGKLLFIAYEVLEKASYALPASIVL